MDPSLSVLEGSRRNYAADPSLFPIFLLTNLRTFCRRVNGPFGDSIGADELVSLEDDLIWFFRVRG